MEYETPTLANLIGGLFGAIFNCVGEGFGGDAVLGFLVIVGVVVMFKAKGIVAWIACGFLMLIALSSAMEKGFTFSEALAGLFFYGGLVFAVVNSLMAIIIGHYWKIKTNLIMGGVWMVLGVIISAVMS